jgi:putative ATP-dependent endonuclease of the OLD family
MNALG